jgi:hypothetical protein
MMNRKDKDPADYAPLHCPEPESISLWHRSAADRPEPARTGVTPVLVFCDATRAFDNETRSFNDFTASAGHDDGHHVVLDEWG